MRETICLQVRYCNWRYKVVERGSADGLYINTCGIGIVNDGINLSTSSIEIGDKVIISGTLGDHGIAVLSGKGISGFTPSIKSDCAPYPV